MKGVINNYLDRQDLYTALVSHCLFPLHEWLKRHKTVEIRSMMEESQFLSREELVSRQIKRLRDFLWHISEYVPYYEKLFAEYGFDPECITDIGDLDRLPVLTKEHIRENEKEMISSHAAGLVRMSTSGSTGQPLHLWVGKERISYDIAAKWRAQRWWGVDIGDPEVVLWSARSDARTGNMLRVIRDMLLRSEMLNVTDIKPAIVSRAIDRIRKKNPRMIFGYTAVIRYLADHMLENDIAAFDNLKVAFVTSERLEDSQRKRIEKAFDCRVANEYGARDAGFIAHECPEGRMHVTMEELIVEIVDDEGNTVKPGEYGHIVITNLASKDFPILRYDTGDIGSLSDEDCTCGRGLMVLSDIKGRSNDFLTAQDGTLVHYTSVTHLLRNLEEIRNFMVVQEDHLYIRLFIDGRERLASGVQEMIKRDIRKRLGKDFAIDFEYVDVIPLTDSGKHRHVINRMM